MLLKSWLLLQTVAWYQCTKYLEQLESHSSCSRHVQKIINDHTIIMHYQTVASILRSSNSTLALSINFKEISSVIYVIQCPSADIFL